MQYHSFTWKGVNSDMYNLAVSEFAPITRPQERVTHVKIPGRAGDLTVLEGEDVYEPYLKTMRVTTMSPDADIHAISSWLRGAGDLICGNEPDYAYEARIINQIDFAKFANNGIRQFSIPFYCQPFKKAAVQEQPITVTASGTMITNPGDVASRPVIVIYGSGDINFILGMQTVLLTGITDGIVLDWDKCDARNLTASENMNRFVTGKAQTIPVGTSFVQWTGSVSRIDIYPNWRYL